MARNELRAEVEAATLAAVERVGGVGNFKPATIAQAFEGRGASRSTVFRWISAYVASGAPTQHVIDRIRSSAVARIERAATPTAEAAAIVVESIPRAVTVDEIAGGGEGFISVMLRLQETLCDLELLVKHAKTEDGKVRNAKLLLAASEAMRRGLETAVRMKEALRQDEDLDRFHKVVLTEIEKCEPAVAERILIRVGRLARQWAASE